MSDPEDGDVSPHAESEAEVLTQGASRALLAMVDPDEPPAKTVEWYRLDITRRMLRVIAVAVPMMMIGGTLASSGLLLMNQRDPGRRYRSRATFQPVGQPVPGADTLAPVAPHAEPPPNAGMANDAVSAAETSPTAFERGLFISGLLLIVGSNLVMLVAMRRVTGSDDFLILRTDGVLQQIADESMLVRWDEVEAVRYDDESDAVGLELRSDAPTIWLSESYTGIQNDALAQRIKEVHRKAIWGLLPQQR